MGSLEKRLEVLREREDAKYAGALVPLSHAGDTLLERVCEYDLYARMILSPDSRKRRAFVSRVRSFLERKYRYDYENPESPEFRNDMTRMFDIAESTTSFAPIAQMYIIHVAVTLESSISDALCPREPDPDDVDALDTSSVDRVAFTVFEERFLLRAFLDVRDAATDVAHRMYVADPANHVIGFVDGLDADYIALLPANVVDASTSHRAGKRRVVFADAGATAYVCHTRA